MHEMLELKEVLKPSRPTYTKKHKIRKKKYICVNHVIHCILNCFVLHTNYLYMSLQVFVMICMKQKTSCYTCNNGHTVDNNVLNQSVVSIVF